MEQNAFMQTGSWLVSRELTEAAGPWDTRLLGDDDGEYFCRVLMASDGVRFVPGAKVYYRQSGFTSLSYRGTSDRQIEAQWLSMEMHIRYLRSLDDSKRAREACVRYLQEWSIIFYPQRIDLFKQADAVAQDLGGRVQLPRLSWKYSWIKAIFGWPLARRAQMSLQRLKWSLVSYWDKMCYNIEGQKKALDSGV
jgi:hypothetical protein